jgi:excisionase family DNA binding protein
MEATRLMPVPEAAKILAVSPATAWSLVSRGEIESVKIGKSRRISTEALSAFIAEHSHGGAE